MHTTLVTETSHLSRLLGNDVISLQQFPLENTDASSTFISKRPAIDHNF